MTPDMTMESSGPFVGLRSYQDHERRFFEGRDEQITTARRKVEFCRFVALVGASGCGKSSLVRAGLIPELRKRSGERWHIVTVVPGDEPRARLARALAAEPLPTVGRGAPLSVDDWTAALTETGDGLVGTIKDLKPAEDVRLLIFVDQFEELIRTEARRGSQAFEEAEAIVYRLVEVARDNDLRNRVRVLVTLRGEFLNSCGSFNHLCRAMEDGIFLIPPLTEDNLRDVIRKPAREAGSDVDEDLADHLASRVAAAPELLPLLQFTLAKMWNIAAKRRVDGPRRDPIFLDHALYEEAAPHEIRDVLKEYADECFKDLGDKPVICPDLSSEAIDAFAYTMPSQQQLLATLFKRLAAVTTLSVQVRSATSIANVRECAIGEILGKSGLPVNKLTQLSADIDKIRQTVQSELQNIVRPFQAGNLSILAARDPSDVLAGSDQLDAETVIDVVHESVFRHWQTAQGWAQEESSNAYALHEIRRIAQSGRSALEAGRWVDHLGAMGPFSRTWAFKYLDTQAEWMAIRKILIAYLAAEEDYSLILRIPVAETPDDKAVAFRPETISVSSGPSIDGAQWPLWSELLAKAQLPEESGIPWPVFRRLGAGALRTEWLDQVQRVVEELITSRFIFISPDKVFELEERGQIVDIEPHVIHISEPVTKLTAGPIDEDDDRMYWNVTAAQLEETEAGKICRVDILLTKVLSVPRSLAEMRHFITSTLEFRYRIAMKYGNLFASAPDMGALALTFKRFMDDVRHLESMRPEGVRQSERNPDKRAEKTVAMFPPDLAQRARAITAEWQELRQQLDRLGADLLTKISPDQDPGRSTDAQQDRAFRDAQHSLVSMVRRLRIISWHFLHMAANQIDRQLGALPI
jgi:energy-coupling factor transporter ATP-binding protein EcfA2